MAHLDARPTGDQVAGSTPTGLATLCREDLILKYFLWSFPSADSRRAVVNFWRKMCTKLVNSLES